MVCNITDFVSVGDTGQDRFCTTFAPVFGSALAGLGAFEIEIVDARSDKERSTSTLHRWRVHAATWFYISNSPKLPVRGQRL